MMKKYLAILLTLGAMISAGAVPAMAQSNYTSGAQDQQTMQPYNHPQY